MYEVRLADCHLIKSHKRILQGFCSGTSDDQLAILSLSGQTVLDEPHIIVDIAMHHLLSAQGYLPQPTNTIQAYIQAAIICKTGKSPAVPSIPLVVIMKEYCDCVVMITSGTFIIWVHNQRM